MLKLDMEPTFPPKFVSADFAGLPEADQKDYEEKPQPPCKPRKFAKNSLELARQYYEMKGECYEME
jgi:hypothetical protein